MVNALVIVAHPDDETVWMGGTILLHPDWNWTILSLCRAFDKDRAPKFGKACKKLGAKCAMSDLEDDHPEKKLKSLDEVKERIREMLKELKVGTDFSAIYTHGRNGEYGHNRHKEVHRAVHELLAGNELRAGKVFFFAYAKARDGFYCAARESASERRAIATRVGECTKSARERSTSTQAHDARTRSARRQRDRNARVVTRLSARIARSKRLLITSTYEFSNESFEARSARAIESFDVEAKDSCDQ